MLIDDSANADRRSRRRIGSLSSCSVARRRGISVVALNDGTIDASLNPSTGVYYRDARHLSRLSFTVDDAPLLYIDSSSSGPVQSALFSADDAPHETHHEAVPECSLVIRHRRVVDRGVRNLFTLSNYAAEARRVQFDLEFAADFADIFEVRGFDRPDTQHAVSITPAERHVAFEYCGVDGYQRQTTISFDPVPTTLTGSEAKYALVIEAGQTVAIDVGVRVDDAIADEPIESTLQRIRSEEEVFLSHLTEIETDNNQVNSILRQALVDILELRSSYDNREFVAAGVPWFDALFGRDSLLTGMMLAPFSPAFLGDALRTLASYQATDYDAASDAEPGKIPHELRWSELARAGVVPFGRYYGTVDATPLFLAGAGEHFLWTRDLETARLLWPALKAALQWCRTNAAATGFLTYSRQSENGLQQQGWKDSWDGVVWPNGTLVAPPMALVEVQSYFLSGLRAYAFIARALGEEAEADTALEEARDFARRFEAAFGHEELGYAFCLDGDGRQVPTPVSNAGHALWAGAASTRLADVSAQRLLQGDMFTGWGVRTLSSASTGFNPLGYHIGSVWPHDNALIVGGLKRYGRPAEARQLATALFEAAMALPGQRLPELFSGDDRHYRLVPTPYPVASRPQAWASASLPYVLSALLGLRPSADGRLVIVNPELPDFLNWVDVRNLRVGGSRVDLRFQRARGDHHARVSIEVGEASGDVEVMVSQNWPEWPDT